MRFRIYTQFIEAGNPHGHIRIGKKPESFGLGAVSQQKWNVFLDRTLGEQVVKFLPASQKLTYHDTGRR